MFFDSDGPHKALFKDDEPVWTVLDRLGPYLDSFFQKDWPRKGITGLIQEPLVIVRGELILDGSISIFPKGDRGGIGVEIDGKPISDAAVVMPGAYLFDDRVIIGPGTVIEPGALLKNHSVIGANTEIRQGAYLRGTCLIGDNCNVGHATEVKNSVFLSGAHAGHFAYVGDSILGRGVNLGAGTKCANLKMIHGNISLASHTGEKYDTGRRKLGAILGDGSETGCNSVTSPGTLMGKKSLIYPCVNMPAGYYPDGTVAASAHDALTMRKRYLRTQKPE